MTISNFDTELFGLIHVDRLTSLQLTIFSEIVAVWGIAIVPVAFALLWMKATRKSRLASVTAALSACLGLAMAGAVSWTVYTPRPFTLGLAPNVLGHVADSSFPSDHLTVIAAAFFALALQRQKTAAILLGLMMLAVGWARVALGIHFPSDIVGGIALGGIAASTMQAPPLRRFAHFVGQVAEALGGWLRWPPTHEQTPSLPPKGHRT